MGDSRIAHWTTKKVADIVGLAPDSNGYTSGLKADKTLSRFAIDFGMHPLMVT